MNRIFQTPVLIIECIEPYMCWRCMKGVYFLGITKYNILQYSSITVLELFEKNYFAIGKW